jgi:hypothetical protein
MYSLIQEVWIWIRKSKLITKMEIVNSTILDIDEIFRLYKRLLIFKKLDILFTGQSLIVRL